MKIALVHKQFTLQGGTERYLVGLACFLAERGHEVHVFCSSIHPVLSGIRGIHFHRIRTFGLGGLLRVLAFWLMTRMSIRRDDFDVVHGFGRTTGHDVIRLGGGCHAAFFDGLIKRASTGWQRLMLRLDIKHRIQLLIERRQVNDPALGRLLVVSERGKEELFARYPVRDGLIQVVYNGVDTQRFHPKNRPLFFSEVRQEVHLDPEDTVLLFVGGDWDRKGLDTAVRVLAELGDKPDLRLLVVGEDRRFARYTALARELGVLEQVFFAGKAERMERLYAAADVMVLPTRYDPFANVTLEALASEVPVVTTGANGAAEVLRDCEAVRVVEDPEDVKGMAAAVRALLEHEDQQRLREVAREIALENRDEANYGRVETIYRDVVLSRRGERAR